MQSNWLNSSGLCTYSETHAYGDIMPQCYIIYLHATNINYVKFVRRVITITFNSKHRNFIGHLTSELLPLTFVKGRTNGWCPF